MEWADDGGSRPAAWSNVPVKFFLVFSLCLLLDLSSWKGYLLDPILKKIYIVFWLRSPWTKFYYRPSISPLQHRCIIILRTQNICISKFWKLFNFVLVTDFVITFPPPIEQNFAFSLQVSDIAVATSKERSWQSLHWRLLDISQFCIHILY